MTSLLLAAALCQLAPDEPAIAEVPAAFHVDAIEAAFWQDHTEQPYQRFIGWSFLWNERHQQYEIVARGYSSSNNACLWFEDGKPRIWLVREQMLVEGERFYFSWTNYDRLRDATKQIIEW